MIRLWFMLILFSTKHITFSKICSHKKHKLRILCNNQRDWVYFSPNQSYLLLEYISCTRRQNHGVNFACEIVVLQQQMMAKMWNNRISYSLMVVIQNGTTTLENSSVVSYETKNTLTMWSKSCAPKKLKTCIYTKTFT